MNDEIKEILDKWKCYIGLTKKFTTNEYEMLRVEDIDKLLDYITNLQQIEQYHKETNATLMSELARLEEENERLKEEHSQLINCRKYDLNLISNLKHDKVRYEEIIDKAIEYIEKHSNSFSVLDTISNSDLLNILQNGDDSQ